MKGSEIEALLAETVVGLQCTGVELYAPHSWRFAFGTSFGLNVQCPWRIVNQQGILLGSEDDGQQFSLSAPVGGARVAMEFLSVSSIQQLVVAAPAGDLLLEFENSSDSKYLTLTTRWARRGGTATH